jgi:membrane carboxypeptidase/penicillin-binding protein PbpC
MITRTTAFTTSDKMVFNTIDEAQQHELELIINDANQPVGNPTDAAVFIVNNRDKIVDILTTNPNSRPSNRKINRKRKQEKAVVDQPNS